MTSLSSHQEQLLKTLQPLGSNILVLRDPPPKEIGGIALPEQARQNWRVKRGQVVSRGGRVVELEAGAFVRFGENAGIILVDEHDFTLLVMDEQEIAIVERTEGGLGATI